MNCSRHIEIFYFSLLAFIGIDIHLFIYLNILYIYLLGCEGEVGVSFESTSVLAQGLTVYDGKNPLR